MKRPKETWKAVRGYAGRYSVSTHGRVRSEPRAVSGKLESTRQIGNRVLKCRVQSNGYLQATLFKDGVRCSVFVQRLVAQAFIPNPDRKPQVNHKDGNKQDNAVWNLEWVTRRENALHAFWVLKAKRHRGEQHANHKLTDRQIQRIRFLHRKYRVGQNWLAKRFRVRQSTIWRVLHDRRGG